MEPVIPADVHRQHISPGSVWFVREGGGYLSGLTRGWCVSPHRLFIQPACLQVSRLQQAERDSSQHSPPDSPSCPAASASDKSENRKRLYPLQPCRVLTLIKSRPVPVALIISVQWGHRWWGVNMPAPNENTVFSTLLCVRWVVVQGWAPSNINSSFPPHCSVTWQYKKTEVEFLHCWMTVALVPVTSDLWVRPAPLVLLFRWCIVFMFSKVSEGSPLFLPVDWLRLRSKHAVLWCNCPAGAVQVSSSCI